MGLVRIQLSRRRGGVLWARTRGIREEAGRNTSVVAGSSFLPYLVFTWTLWHLQRWMTREDCCNQVAPGLWVGRRAFPEEIPSDTTTVIDLTAEFPVPRGVTEDREYICVPTLDTCMPKGQHLVEHVSRIRACRGPLYINCASGHGRSAALAAAILISRGVAGTLDEAERSIKAVRPGIGLSNAQRQIIGEALPSCAPQAAMPEVISA